jgi:hypothetical protein
MTMDDPDPFLGVAGGEEFVAAACAVVSSWVPAAEEELAAIAASHLDTATRLRARPRRWLKLLVTLRATLAAAARTELGALVWLRRQEQRLVDAYVALEGSPQLLPADRQTLRRQLVPSAFERFSRVDRLIMLREETGVYA